MRCPFLREAQVKSCSASPYRKAITRIPGHDTTERCLSTTWKTCTTTKEHIEEHPSLDRCPFLVESLAQYCSAVPGSSYVPYVGDFVSRCSSESHAYCEAFLTKDQARHQGVSKTSIPEFEKNLDGMIFSRNHLWMKTHDDGSCHIGMDGFLSDLLMDIEKIDYPCEKGVCFPAAVVTVRGTELILKFPRNLQLTRVNTYLRARPSDITSHPYTLGWFFEGTVPAQEVHPGAEPTDAVLITGESAKRWLEREPVRLTYFLREKIVANRAGEFATMLDGGVFSRDLIRHLTQEEIQLLFREFLSSPVGRSIPPE